MPAEGVAVEEDMTGAIESSSTPPTDQPQPGLQSLPATEDGILEGTTMDQHQAKVAEGESQDTLPTASGSEPEERTEGSVRTPSSPAEMARPEVDRRLLLQSTRPQVWECSAT